MRATHFRQLARGLAEVLRLPRTAARIVEILSRTSRHLSVTEIVSRVRMSERSVRGNLAMLIRRGILERKSLVTTKRRIAYVYGLRPVDDLLKAIHEQMSQNLRALHRAAGIRLNPRSAGSSRS